jgi:hypothetical protein
MASLQIPKQPTISIKKKKKIKPNLKKLYECTYDFSGIVDGKNHNN